MIYLKQANSETLTFGPIKHSDGTPVDMTHATVKLIIKEKIEDEDYDAVWSQALVNPESNMLTYIMSAAETKAISVGEYIIGLKIFFDDGIELEIDNDRLIMEKGVFNE